jgi:hypothetical protein
MDMAEEQMNLKEPEGIAQAIPPQEHSPDLEENRIDVVDVRSEHLRSVFSIEQGADASRRSSAPDSTADRPER